MSSLVFDPLDHSNNFTVAVQRLTGTKGKTVDERNKEVDQLIEQYIENTGDIPHPEALDELADYILQDDLTDPSPNKITKTDFPILSKNQTRHRNSKEVPLEVLRNIPLNYTDYNPGGIVVCKEKIKSFMSRFKVKNKYYYGNTSFVFRDEKHREWANKVKKKDNFTCQCCGSNVNQLHAHHIEAFNHAPDLRYVVNNGITLCNWCHDDFHSRYGKGFNTRKQIDEWLKTLKTV